MPLLTPDWFEALTGFRETSPHQVRENMFVDAGTMTSRVNGRTMSCGRLETPSLGELRERVRAGGHRAGRISARELVGNVRDLHADASLAGSLFQVASQFNLLEMRSPRLLPEEGVGIYERDHTQGPACAIAAGAGTIYRNYFAPVNGRRGQTANNQIDCLAGIGEALGNSGKDLWTMKNGYALASNRGLIQISRHLQALNEKETDELRKLLRIGVQWNTQVTLNDCKHNVSQCYCSALPVAYCSHPASAWESFARLVLESAYEAAVCTAILNARDTGNRKLFLTLLGGSAFGNPNDWIIDAIHRALHLYRYFDLDVASVSFGSSTPLVKSLVDRLSGV